MLVKAADRLELAQFMMPVLDSIDRVTEDMRLMVTRDTLEMCHAQL